MPERELQVGFVTALLPNGLRFAEVPAFPEIAVLEADAKRLEEVLATRVRQVLSKTPLFELHRRRGATDMVADRIILKLTPPKRHPAWVQPVELPLDYVSWRLDADTQFALVPAFNLQIIAQGRQVLAKRVEEEVRAALARLRLVGSLGGLAELLQPTELQPGNLVVGATLHTPRQEAEMSDEPDPAERTVLEEVAMDLAARDPEPAWENAATVARIAEVLGSNPPRSVLLVGPSGVGKTAAVQELVRRRAELGFGHTPFVATTGSRLVAGMTGFGMWQARCLRFVREASHRRAIVHLGSLFELINVGASASSAQGIAAFLRPFLQRGELLAIAEATPQELRLIERLDPALLRAFEEIRVVEPEPEVLWRILSKAGESAPGGRDRWVTEDAIEAVIRLHRRYESYSASPGRPLRFLRHLLTEPGAGDEPVDEARVNVAFSRMTGLPAWLIQDEIPFDPVAARAWFGERVIGQAQAAQEVVGTIALAKARMARPERPLASFLFIGPTGVGKTEMVKALAEFLFGDRTRIVRFDMSEFAHAGAVERLAGGAWDREGLLTSRLREQPFCVVLLDEFEKAHPAIHDLLLQVLGEARLTDAGGNLAWFGNAVVVLTSNLGAQDFQRAPAGFTLEGTGRRDAREHFSGVIERFLRPELVNRLDAIIPFLPLDEPAALAVTRRELDLALRRDGLRLRPVELEIDPGVAVHLMRRGFDPAYGARPLKRVLERECLVPLAYALNEYTTERPLKVELRMGGERVHVRVAAARSQPSDEQQRLLGSTIEELTRVRRQVQHLVRNPAHRDLENQIQRGEQLSARVARGAWVDDAAREAITRLPLQRDLARQIQDLLEEVGRAESAALIEHYTGQDAAAALEAARSAFGSIQRRLRHLLEVFLWLRTAHPDRLVLGLYFRNEPDLFKEWARAHVELARRLGLTVAGHAMVPGDAFKIGRHALRLRPVQDLDAFLEGIDENTLPGFVLELDGRLARAWYSGTDGWHAVHRNAAIHQFRAHVGGVSLAAYRPPEHVGARSWGGDPVQCVFDEENRTLIHAGADPEVWNGDYLEGLEDLLTTAFTAQLRIPLS